MAKRSKPDRIEMRLMMLGAMLVADNPSAARIVAEAMAHIQALRRQLAERNDGGGPNRKGAKK